MSLCKHFYPNSFFLFENIKFGYINMARNTYNCTEEGFCVIDTSAKKSKSKKFKSKKKAVKLFTSGTPCVHGAGE